MLSKKVTRKEFLVSAGALTALLILNKMPKSIRTLVKKEKVSRTRKSKKVAIATGSYGYSPYGGNNA